MRAETRLLLSLLVRLLFLFFAGWFALNPDAVPGAHAVTRIGLSALFLVLAVLMGEVQMLRTHLGALVHALRATTAGAAAAAGAAGAAGRDDRAAVDILIRALASPEAATREKAHRNLRRITGQDLPEDRERWEAWWAEHRAGFVAAGAAAREDADAP